MSLGAGTKRWVKKALLGSGALRLAGRLNQSAAIILMYHSVQDRPELYANSVGIGIIHATSVFERQMELVARRYNPVTLEDILLFLKGEERLPPRPVAVTFDDGYADNLHVAAPVLDRFGVRAAFYLTVDLIGTKEAPWFCRLRHAFGTTCRKRWTESGSGRVWMLGGPSERQAALLAAFDSCAPMVEEVRRAAIRNIEQDLEVEPLAPANPLMMNWDQARKLRDAGHIVGSHTLTHPNVAHLDESDARRELVNSKRRLEEELEEPVVHFSYPHPALNPSWTPGTVALTQEAGYRTAVTTTGGPVRSGADPLALTRTRAPRPEHEFLWNLECAFLGRPM